MRKIINLSIQEIKPDRTDVFISQGVKPEVKLPARMTTLYDSSLETFRKQVDPIGIFSEISISEFNRIYQGNGMNEKDTPIEHIFPNADNLALFAFTLGEKISQTISSLFKSKDYANGYMLDSIASVSVDKAAGIAENYFLNFLSGKGQTNESTVVLIYSPGFCGWHISSQKKLIEYLKPEDIGIVLNKQFLMIPLKSISGALIAGKKKIHHFKNTFPFCDQCQTHNCRERINSLRKQKRSKQYGDKT